MLPHEGCWFFRLLYKEHMNTPIWDSSNGSWTHVLTLATSYVTATTYRIYGVQAENWTLSSGITVQRSAIELHATRWYLYLCTRQGSNLRPDPLRGNALPTELLMHLTDQAGFEPTNLLVNSEVHYQFCYWPMMYGLSRIWTCGIWFRRPVPCPLGYKSINLPSRDRTDLNRVYSAAFIHWIIGRQGGLGRIWTCDHRIKSPKL